MVTACSVSSSRCIPFAAPVTQLLTEIEGELRVVVSLSVSDKVDLVLTTLLLEALLGAPVLAHADAGQNND